MNWPALVFAFGSTFALACGDSPSGPSNGEPTELAPGQSVVIAAGRVTFEAITNDSRCPVDVVCVWEGEAVVRLRLDPSGEGPGRTVDLKTPGDRSVPFGGMVVELLEVTPAPRSTQPIPSASYRVVVRFVQAR